MKKTQVALAALALVASTAALADGVKLYGAIDATVVNTNGGTVISPGDNVGSILGFAVNEDLGNGMKAGGTLELGYNPADGLMRNGGTQASTANPVFNRQANLFIGTDAATVKVGLQISPMIETLGSGLNSYGGNGLNVPAMGILGTYSAVTGAAGFFIPNAASVQFNAGAISGNILRTVVSDTATVQGSNYTAARFTTNFGDLNLNVGYEGSKHSTASTPVDYTLVAVMGSMPLTSEITLNAGYTNRSNKDSATDQKAYTFGVAYKMSDSLGVGINYTANNATAKSSMLGIGTRYNLSARTAVYLQYSDFKNNTTGILQNGGSTETVSAANPYSDSVIGIGVSHSF